MIKQLKLFVLFAVTLYCAIYPFVKQPAVDIDANNNVEQPTPTESISKPVVAVEIKSYRSESLPDFSQYKDVKQKKRAFFGYLAPLVRDINKEMVHYLSVVESIDHTSLSLQDKARLHHIAKKFHIDTEQDTANIKQELLLRVGELPVELVLMQAANESAWGTSRFALVANNLFGQWCFKPGCGVVPSGRPKGEKYEVRKFAHPIDSIRSYFNNLNTGHAYSELRAIRLKLRESGEKLDASALAEGLLSYSIRRHEYVKEIQAMIRINSKYIPVE